ncbi:MAG: glycosyltransferase family 4 protein [Bacteroidota bacterium]
MKILHIIPGSGGSFYCGNCLRDSKYVDALRKQQHDVVKIPMYLPLFSDEHDITDIPVFYGAVSIYLKQVFPLFRKAPAWFDKMLNSKPILKLAAGFAGSTRAKGLEEMTVSMLLGEQGQQKEELERMIDWIAAHCQPDIIHLSNALLLGLARELKKRLDVPVLCSLQDEDTWVDVMQPGARKRVWKLMEDRSEDVSSFISVSTYYQGVMKELMNIPGEKLTTVHLGVDPADYKPVPAGEKPRKIGFISRMCYDNGLDILVDAFILLKKKPGFDDVSLVITGGSTGDDARFIKGLKRKIRTAGLFHSVEFHDEFEGEGRQEFFRKVSLISVPVRNGEAFGIYLLEAMTSGIPVVQPELGAFPEIVTLTGGGLLYEPNHPSVLATTLARVLSDRELHADLSARGIRGVAEHFDINTQAGKMIDIYRQYSK